MIRRLAGHPGKSTHYPMIFSPLRAKCGSLEMHFDAMNEQNPAPDHSGDSAPVPPPPTLRPAEPATLAAPVPPIPAGTVPPLGVPDHGPQEASFGTRVGGFAIDLLISTAIYILIGALNNQLAFLASCAYLVLRDCLPFLDGQSIGKKALKTRAVTNSGASLSGNWNSGLLRNLPLVVPLFPLVELIVMSSRVDQPRLRRLCDDWFNTKVINVPQTTPPSP
jgi:hypothetical protein